ncbi:MAG: T9SS type A sorting domain-containing protein [Ignavibacteria bacterium]
MKILITLTIFFMGFTEIRAQNQDYDENFTQGNVYEPTSSYMLAGSWTVLSNSPNSVSRSCCAYVEISGVPYIYQFGGGNSTTEMKRVSRLNLATNTWQNNYSTMPTQMSSATAITINGGTDIYVFGGNTQPGVLGKTLKYNVASNSWQTKADMLTQITDALVLKYNESHIFVIGGGDGYFGSTALKTNKVQLYNVTNNSYSYKTDLPMPIAMMGGGLYRDTIITAGGYTTGGVSIANCYKGVINPSTLNITWTSLPSYPPGTVTRLASYVAVKGTGVGIMFTGGAIGGNAPTAQTHFWNFCTQSWQPGLPDNSQARSNFKACGLGYDVVYTVGGYTTNNNSNRTESLTFSQIDGPCQNMVGINNNSIPVKFELKQNYPNPFNPETKISFSVPTAGNVKITVTNINGEQVSELVNGMFLTGNHSVTFRPDNLASGIYFYTIISGNYKETKKMLLVK